MRHLVSLVLALVFMGCATMQTYKAMSVGTIGCPADEIEITNESKDLFGPQHWTATCRGHRFYCSTVALGEKAVGVSCRPELNELKPQN